MVRGSDDKVRVLYNRCRHRANLMCHKDAITRLNLFAPTMAGRTQSTERWLRRALAELTALQ
jgi:hypothetical protein